MIFHKSCRQQHGAHSDMFVWREMKQPFWADSICAPVSTDFYSGCLSYSLGQRNRWLLMWMCYFCFLNHCENEKIPETPFRFSQMPLTRLYGPMHPEQKKINCAKTRILIYVSSFALSTYSKDALYISNVFVISD